jgi:hypothetical protein
VQRICEFAKNKEKAVLMQEKSPFENADVVNHPLRVQYEKLFPLTLQHFQAVSTEQWPKFLQELEIDDPQKAANYWPLFLRKLKAPLAMIELAYFESACHQAMQTSESGARLEGLSLNPSSQVIPIDRSAELMGRSRGVYIVYRYQSQLKIEALSLAEALCFEQIQEDRLFSVEQFEQWMQIEFAEEGLDANPKSVIQKMLNDGILKVNQGGFL